MDNTKKQYILLYISRYKESMVILGVCLLLNLEFWILGPFSFVQQADNADIMMSYYIRLVQNFFEYGPTYWADYMSIGADRISNTFSLLRFPALLLMIFPDWLAYQLLVILQVYIPALFAFKLSFEQLNYSKKSALVGALSYAFLISIGEHNFHFGYEFGVLLFPAVIYVLNLILLQRGIKKYFFAFLVGAIYSVVFSPIAKNLPFVLPFIFLWFFIFKDKEGKYPLLFLSVFLIGSIFSQIQEIIALISHAGGSQREFVPNRYNIKNIVDVIYLYKLEFIVVMSIAMATKMKNKSINYFVVLFPTLIFSFYYLTPIIHYFLPFIKSFSFKRFGLFIPFNVAFLITLFMHYSGLKLNEWKNLKKLKTYILGLIILISLLGLVNVKLKTVKQWLMLHSYNSFFQWKQIQKLSDNNRGLGELFRVEVYAQSHMTPAMLATYGLDSAGGYLIMYPQYLFEFWKLLLEKGLKAQSLNDEHFLQTHLYLYLWPEKIPLNQDYFKFKVKVSDNYNLNLLSLLNVKYISSRVRLDDENLELIEEGSEDFEPGYRLLSKYGYSAIFRKEFIDFIWQRVRFNFTTVGKQYLYLNKSYLPRFFLTKKISVFNNSESLLEGIRSATSTQLKENAFILLDDVPKELKIESPLNAGSVKITQYSPDKIIIEVDSDGDGVLVGSNTYSKYWRCRINGNPDKIFKVNHSLWGVRIVKGKSIIEFDYVPPYALSNIL